MDYTLDPSSASETETTRSVREAKEILEFVYNEAKLLYGVVFLQNRMEMASRLALFKMYQDDKNGPTKRQATDILASQRYFQVLQKVSGNRSMDEIVNDVNVSIPITAENLMTFSKTFSSHIEGLLNIIKS